MTGLVQFKSFVYRTSVDNVRGRSAVLHSGNKPALAVSAPLEFKGDPALWNPEDLFVASIEVCLMLTFVGIAERKGLAFVSYSSTAEGLLEWEEDSYVFTRVVIRPEIVLPPETSATDAREVLERAHRTCLVARSTRSTIVIEPTIR